MSNFNKFESNNIEKKFMRKLDYGILSQYIHSNPGDLQIEFNLKNIDSTHGESIKLIRSRKQLLIGKKIPEVSTRINDILSRQKENHYDDSKYFDEKNESLDETIYEIGKDDVLNLYRDGTIKITKNM